MWGFQKKPQTMPTHVSYQHVIYTSFHFKGGSICSVANALKLYSWCHAPCWNNILLATLQYPITYLRTGHSTHNRPLKSVGAIDIHWPFLNFKFFWICGPPSTSTSTSWGLGTQLFPVHCGEATFALPCHAMPCTVTLWLMEVHKHCYTFQQVPCVLV